MKQKFVEILGLQVQLLTKTDGRDKERWVFSPDVILDFTGRIMTGSELDMVWYRWVCVSIMFNVAIFVIVEDFLRKAVCPSNPACPFQQEVVEKLWLIL